MPRGRVQRECNTLAAGAFSDPDGDEHGATHWQISERCDDFADLVAERYRAHENWYAGVDTQSGDDLTDEPIVGLEDGRFYCWRARYRDRALAWSAWSTPVAFMFDPMGVGVAGSCDDPTPLEMPPPDAGPTPVAPPSSSGCGCRVGGGSERLDGGLALGALAGLLLLGRVRRRRVSAP